MSTQTKTFFHESYGTVTQRQFNAYRSCSVSRFDHDILVRVYGESNHEAITRAVRLYSPLGTFTTWRFKEDHDPFY